MSSTTGPIPPQNGRQRSAERAVGSERLVDWVDFRLLAGAPRHRGQTRCLAQEYVQVSNLGTANCRHGPRLEEAGHGQDISALNESKSKYQRDATASVASAATCRSAKSRTRVTARHASQETTAGASKGSTSTERGTRECFEQERARVLLLGPLPPWRR